MRLHASCVALNGQGVLLAGPSGIGKSDLALRLIDAGGMLVADDQTELWREGDKLIASPPATLAGLIEAREIGLLKLPFLPHAPVALYIELVGLDEDLERLPVHDPILLLDRPVRRLRLYAFAGSAVAKIRAALTYDHVHDEQ
jgi:serine kinase of HPr protein (carbohydrate metabolism regulator)